MSSPRPEHPVKWVQLGECEVMFRDAQRSGVNERTVADIVENFDPLAFGFPFVAQINGGGRYHIIDGQNRITALRRMGWEDYQEIQAQVCHVANKKDAARLFVLRNTFRKPTPVDQFRAAVTAGFDDEVAVDRLVRSMGFTVGSKSNARTISAVNALTRAYRKHGEQGLRSALAAISETWRSDSDRTRGQVIEAWSRLFDHYGDLVDAKRLAKRIGKKYTAGNLIAAARSSLSMFGGTLTDNVLRATVAQYNTGLRTNALIELDG